MRATIVLSALLLALGPVSLAAAECKSSFFSLPTASVDGQLFLISEKSGPAFCRMKGFPRGVVTSLPDTPDQLPKHLNGLDIHILDIAAMSICDGTCDLALGVECVPKGEDNCGFDGKLNIGNNNTGMSNEGNNNVGQHNLGSNNVGDKNVGNNNVGTKRFCHNLRRDGDRCTLDMLRTADTLELKTDPTPPAPESSPSPPTPKLSPGQTAPPPPSHALVITSASCFKANDRQSRCQVLLTTAQALKDLELTFQDDIRPDAYAACLPVGLNIKCEAMTWGDYSSGKVNAMGHTLSNQVLQADNAIRITSVPAPPPPA
ncbi:hypothetical protein ACKKBF_B39105 [Auxenochlorella protothecoides x Auxenochlorella symbiontica]